MTKKTLGAITLLLIAAALITFRIISYDTSDSTLLTKANSDSPEIDKLFGDMAITKVPRVAPPVDISLLDLNGKTVTLSELKGKIVFLNFWTTWCPPCREEMPSMQNLYTRFKDSDFAMLAVSMNEPASVVKTFFKDFKLTFTALLDSKGELGAPFGVRAIPMTYIFDKDGAIIGKVTGPRRWDIQKSTALFEYLINKTVRNATVEKHQQKKSISFHSVKSGPGTGNPAANSASAC